MKLSTYLMALLIIGCIFFVFALMVTESNTNYPTANLNSSVWANKYDFAMDINSTISPIQESFSNIENPDVGWFSKIVSGIAAIPYAVITLPVAVFKALVIGGKISVGFMTAFLIPAYIIEVMIIMITLWGIVKLIEVFQRWFI